MREHHRSSVRPGAGTAARTPVVVLRMMRLREATRRSQPIHLGGRRSTRRWRIASAWAHGRTKGGRWFVGWNRPAGWSSRPTAVGWARRASPSRYARGADGRTSVSTASRSARRAVRSGVSVRLDGLSRELLAGGELDESIHGPRRAFGDRPALRHIQQTWWIAASSVLRPGWRPTAVSGRSRRRAKAPPDGDRHGSLTTIAAASSPA